MIENEVEGRTFINVSVSSLTDIGQQLKYSQMFSPTATLCGTMVSIKSTMERLYGKPVTDENVNIVSLYVYLIYKRITSDDKLVEAIRSLPLDIKFRSFKKTEISLDGVKSVFIEENIKNKLYILAVGIAVKIICEKSDIVKKVISYKKDASKGIFHGSKLKIETGL